MEVGQLTEISEKVYNNIQNLTPSDIVVLMEILKKDQIKYGKIRTFSLEDSHEIILLTLKQNCIILIKYLLENEIQVSEDLLDCVYSLVNLKPSGYDENQMQEMNCKQPIDLHAQIEKERIIVSIHNLIIDIVCISKYINESLINFLKNRKIPDNLSVNLSIVIPKELDLESFELTVLSKKILGPVLLSLVKSYKNSMRKLAKRKIIEHIIPYINSKDKETVYEIFYIINEENHKKLLVSIKPESSPEYFGFISSLIVDRQCAEIAYNKLEPNFEILESALQTLLSLPKFEEKSLQIRDLHMIEYLLECINRISKYKCFNFFKFISLFQSLLKIKIGRKIKGIIYDILSKYLQEKDIYISKIIECREEVETEIKTKDYYLLPRVIRFLNSYQKREERETELIRIGQSMGSPYANFDSLKPAVDKNDFRMLGFKSEDPDTVIECLDTFIFPNILKMNSVHIRNVMIKDTSVIDRLIEYQIENKCIIDDISIVNTIISHSSPKFFEYARLFKDFSFYLNGDVLERIGDDLQSGVEWIKECYSKDFGVFMIRNCDYFNELLKMTSTIQKKILPIYEKILDENLSEVEFFVFGSSVKAPEGSNIFYLHDSADLLISEFFRIFAKQLIYKKFYCNIESPSRYIIEKYTTSFYEIFIKAKAVCELDISSDIEFMKSNLLASDDLLGYLKASSLYSTSSSEPLGSNILLNFGVKDNSFFLKHFPDENEFGKFILFFNLQYVNKEIDIMIKDEIMRNLKNPNRTYLRMCVLQLFKTKDLDQILKILEKSFEDKEILFKLSIHNIVNGGKYFSKNLIDCGDELLKSKALFLLYYLGIWEKEYLLELINKVDLDISEDMKYLAEDIKRF